MLRRRRAREGIEGLVGQCEFAAAEADQQVPRSRAAHIRDDALGTFSGRESPDKPLRTRIVTGLEDGFQVCSEGAGGASAVKEPSMR